MSVREALEVIHSLFDYLSLEGNLDQEDWERMNEAEEVLETYAKKTGGYWV